MSEFLALKEEDKIEHPLDYNDPLLDFNVYQQGKAGYHTLEKELTSCFQGTVPATIFFEKEIDHCYDAMYHAWKSLVGPVTPLSWAEALESKDPKTSVGIPLTNSYSNYEDLLSDFSVEELATIFQEIEDDLINTSIPIGSWKPFPKFDKYSSRKVRESKFRLVSVGNLFLLTLCKKYLELTTRTLEEAIPQFYLITGNEQFVQKYVQRQLNSYSWGVDYTAYDKNSSGYFILKMFELLDRLTQRSIPKRVLDYLALSIAQPVSIMVDHTGSTNVFLLSNSNPSGQYLTSFTNSLTHILHNSLFLLVHYKVETYDFLHDQSPLLKSVMTGDDGVDSSATKEMAEKVSQELAAFVEYYFNIPVKLDLYINEQGQSEPFPPGLAPVYLNKCLVINNNGQGYLFPANPRRLIPRLLFAQENEIKGNLRSLMQERSLGIAQEIKPYLIHQYLNPALPKNSVFEALKTAVESRGVVFCPPQMYLDEFLFGCEVKILH